MFGLRLILRGLLGGTAVAAGVAGWSLLTLDTQALRDLTSDALTTGGAETRIARSADGTQAATGSARVTFGGPPTIGFGPFPSVRIPDITMRRLAPNGRTETLRAESVELQLDTLSLAAGTAQVARVVVNNPQVVIDAGPARATGSSSPFSPLGALSNVLPGNPSVLVNGGTIALRGGGTGLGTIELGTGGAPVVFSGGTPADDDEKCR
jgi:hypothetical protein